MKNFSKLVLGNLYYNIIISLDPFCFNQFDKKSGAAAFLDYDRLQFIDKVNSIYNPDDLKEGL